jgi:acyl-CoA dehydrogenase
MAIDRDTFEQLLDTLHRFVRERLIPREREVEETDRVPPEIVAEMRALGLFGLSIPERFGGIGLDAEEEMRAVFELAYAAPCFRSVVGTNNGIGSQGILIDGSEAQKERYLPRIAAGEIITSFALTEPDAGSDAASLKTSARRVDGGWLLNGTKRYITNAPVASLFTVMARSDPDDMGASGISAFLVEAPRAGLVVGKPDRKMGQRGALTADVVFSDCFVPGDAIIGGRESQGFKTAMKVLDRGRLHMSAVCVGAAERLIAESVRYARERVQFGKPIGEFQLVQAMLADSRTEAYAARAMVLDAARRKDAGENIATEASCCKYFASEMVSRVADRAVQIHGGAGYVADHGIERLYRDVRLFRIFEGTSQIQQLVIARAMLKG